MIQYFKRINSVTFFYFLFITSLFFIFLSKLFNGYEKESWQITELLINYQGGFVRRGLLGEGLLILYNTFGLNPYYTIIVICLLCFFLVLIFFIRAFIKNGYPVFILPFVFFLGAPILNDFIIRKDLMTLLFFISVIYFIRKNSIGNLLLVNFVLCLGILIHEELGFLCFPVLFLILINESRKFKYSYIISFIISAGKILPSIIVFGLCIHYNGSVEISESIWNSWKHIPFPIQSDDINTIPGAIDGISWSPGRALSHTFHTLKDFSDDIYSPIAWLIILTLVYYFLTNTNKLKLKISKYETTRDFDKGNISNILIFQLIAVLPLFIIGCDYGRWVFLWVATSFAILLLSNDQYLSTLFPGRISRISTRLNKILNSFFSSSQGFIYAIPLIIGIPAFKWDILKYLNTNPVIIVLKFISKLIQLVLLQLKEFLN